MNPKEEYDRYCKKHMIEVLKRAEAYFRGNKNVQDMNGPEYGIWHNIISLIEKAEGRE